MNDKVSAGRVSGATLAVGPWGQADGSYQFSGTATSYVEIPNTQGQLLDFRRSVSILAWIYWEGKPGPIVNYHSNGFGVHLWATGQNQLFARFVKRNGDLSKPLTFSGLQMKSWQYVGCSYNYITGEAKLWLNSKAVIEVKLEIFEIQTQFDIRIGARLNDQRFFKGRIACVQFYPSALTGAEIAQVKDVCKGN